MENQKEIIQDVEKEIMQTPADTSLMNESRHGSVDGLPVHTKKHIGIMIVLIVLLVAILVIVIQTMRPSQEPTDVLNRLEEVSINATKTPEEIQSLLEQSETALLPDSRPPLESLEAEVLTERLQQVEDELNQLGIVSE